MEFVSFMIYVNLQMLDTGRISLTLFLELVEETSLQLCNLFKLLYNLLYLIESSANFLIKYEWPFV